MWGSRLIALVRRKNSLLIVLPGMILSLAVIILLHLRLNLEFSPWIMVRLLLDVLVLLSAAMILEILPRCRRFYTFIILFFWCVFQQASFEYELNKFMPLRFEDMRFLNSPDFLLSSGLRIWSLFFFILFFAVSIVLALGVTPVIKAKRKAAHKAGIIACIVACLVLFVALQLPAGRPWQAIHPVSAFAYSSVKAITKAVEQRRVDYTGTESPESFGYHLTPVIEKGTVKGKTYSESSAAGDPGKRIVGPAPGRNVLLLVLEGVSAAYLPAVAAQENHTPSLVMTNLNSIARHAFYSPNFVIQIHQTIRGLYSLLTGDYPKLDLSSPKAFEVVAMGSGEVESLPRTLGRNGYHTVYLQAAGLAFMEKDRFMKAAGFNEVHGNEWFADKETLVNARWGVDDHSFFEGSREMIERLRSSDQPWFLTLLTVGTHHPYNLVPDYFDPRGVDDWTRSVIFLDYAVGRFFSYLEDSGILEDTLVIITSDEFRGYPDKPLKCNWGLNMLLVPEMTGTGCNPSLFGQIDLPYSVLDYLGLEEQMENEGRRSFFRRYEKAGRELFFTRIGWGQLWFRPENLLFRMENDEMFAYQLNPEAFFNRDNLVEIEIDEKVKEQVYREMNENISYLDRSVYSSTDEGPWKFRLAEKREHIVRNRQKTVLADGQYFSLPPSKVTLEILIENRKESTGRVKVDECFFYSGNEFRKIPVASFPWISPGKTMEFSYSYDFPESPRQLCLRLVLKAEGGESVILVKKALISAIPFPSGQKPKGGHLNRLVVE